MNLLFGPLVSPSVRCSSRIFKTSRLHTNVHAFTQRKYATHRNSPLPASLDTPQRTHMPTRDTAGPFQLGISQASLQQGEKVKKWSELNASGKVLRTTQRTTNLTVILLGAGLSALLVYSLTSELFSKNSPTVLYSKACERIKSSARIAKYLKGPLTFHNNPPSTQRPRHRNRHVTSQVMIDSYGNEHMIMTFYVQGKPKGWSGSASDQSYLESASQWAQEKYENISDLTYEETVTSVKERAEFLWEKLRGLFKYLSGISEPPRPPVTSATLEAPAAQKKEDESVWGLGGLFSSLKGPRRSIEGSVSSPSQIFTEGEVHADLIRNEQGYFVFRYLLIDMPSTRHPHPVRVFIERAPGVRENEPVMRWSTHS
ncbi:hypothetical protein AMATHDRAFT_63564 [Amanita thiersii Skay4041]|uniref:Mitochondrial import inner membrane translocase subunit Tim21 n=1 Tax=Amanita thiersii Skay4041 TaxID=703135 RepID=A0A2A9NDU8_9AGAR|nr:hypothetical protein AMATHDRAFT_63564 [Amanita thiersii Skay4041]